MIQHPAPTRAEVTDIAVAVREGSDAVMLSGESAYGAHPVRSVEVMGTVCSEAEKAQAAIQPKTRSNVHDIHNGAGNNQLSQVIAYHAAQMSDTLRCPLVVFSRHGNLPRLLSRVRPESTIFCFTDNQNIQRRLALYHSVVAFHIHFKDEAETTYEESVSILKEHGLVHSGQALVLVQGGKEPIWKTRSPYAAHIRHVL